MAEPILYTFVDNSNVLIESQRFAQMKRKGKSKLSAFTDDTYEIDWGKFLCKSRQASVQCSKRAVNPPPPAR